MQRVCVCVCARARARACVCVCVCVSMAEKHEPSPALRYETLSPLDYARQMWTTFVYCSWCKYYMLVSDRSRTRQRRIAHIAEPSREFYTKRVDSILSAHVAGNITQRKLCVAAKACHCFWNYIVLRLLCYTTTITLYTLDSRREGDEKPKEKIGALIVRVIILKSKVNTKSPLKLTFREWTGSFITRKEFSTWILIGRKFRTSNSMNDLYDTQNFPSIFFFERVE